MKSAARLEAIRLRREGTSYDDIRQRFGIAKSTLWRWLKAEGLVDTQPQRITELRRLAQQKGAAATRTKRIVRTQAIFEQAKSELRELSLRDLWTIGIALYWAEGTKQKPHNVGQRVAFSNSDPAMVKFFVIWLNDICHVPNEQLAFELYIHESADIEAARAYWAATLQLSGQKLRVRLKRHKVSPHRRNIGTAYVGLVRVSVRRSADLNRRITGWIQGISQGVGESANGKPPDFGSGYPGSTPGSPAMLMEPGCESFDDMVIDDCDIHDLIYAS